jgi:DNA helicase MCM8
MRSQASLGNSIPVNTRHLESLIRLAQARARMECREVVTKEDALDVVDLLNESLLDAFTLENGEVDVGGRRGGMGPAKQIRALVSQLAKESQMKGNKIFSKSEIAMVANGLKLDKDIDTLVETLRTECYLLLQGANLYRLNN